MNHFGMSWATGLYLVGWHQSFSRKLALIMDDRLNHNTRNPSLIWRSEKRGLASLPITL
jgi:hypothetical protein